MWEALLKAHPEPTGIDPVFVITGNSTLFSFGGDHFLYFKHKGPRKIYYIQYESDREEDRLTNILPGSIETLNDSRRLIAHWKRRGINRGEQFTERERAMFENAKGVNINKNMEPQEVTPQKGNASDKNITSPGVPPAVGVGQ